MDFKVKLGPDDHAFHKVFDGVLPGPGYTGPPSVRYGLTLRASCLSPELRALAGERRARPDHPYPVFESEPYVTMLGPRRIEVDNIKGWEATDYLLAEALARNHTRDWIFRDKSLLIEGSTYESIRVNPGKTLFNITKIIIS